MSNSLLINDENRALEYFMEGEFYLIKEKQQLNGISYIGQFEKKILLITNEKITQSNKVFVDKIMAFVKVAEKDYAFISREDTKYLDIDQVINNFNPNKLVIWGEAVIPMLPIFSKEVYQGVDVVTSIQLSVLENNKEAKHALAAALKILFSNQVQITI